MEHITITEVKEGLYRLTPDKGYILKDKATRLLYTEAVVKEDRVSMFEAVEITE